MIIKWSEKSLFLFFGTFEFHRQRKHNTIMKCEEKDDATSQEDFIVQCDATQNICNQPQKQQFEQILGHPRTFTRAQLRY